MKDLQDRLAKLLADAEDCDLIGNLAQDKEKRDLFRKLATDLRAMASDIQKLIAIKSASRSDLPSGSDRDSEHREAAHGRTEQST